jgi:uncharacterized protein YxeA
MKKILLSAVVLLTASIAFAQTYPEPEFSNEVYYLKKDSAHSLVRLEKSSSKMETKSKAAGFGGFENGYAVDGAKSDVRLNNGANLSFVFSTGASVSSSSTSSAQKDSMMRANGMDPSIMSGMGGGMSDPANNVTLYKADAGKGIRKIYMMKTGGAFSMGKNKSSDKFTFSVKKIREGYWELVVDKPLPKGEYAFVTMGGYSGGGGMDALLFAFGID